MLKALFVSLVLSLSFTALGDERRAKILSIIDDELREVSRLSKQNGNRDPELLLRISELQMEKARLQRETENEKFLSIPAEKRRNTDEKAFYAESTRSFQSANQYASSVIKNFPAYKDIADVYYILAFNNRELKNYDTSQKYFTEATKRARKGSDTFHKSQLALAESLYNNNEYAKAIPLYEGALQKIDGTWWTKDAFNLAWAYYRMKDYNKAIETMKEIHRRSGNVKYINMRYFVERDIGIFFVDARRPNDAVAWYKAQGIDFATHLVKIAKTLVPQGKFTQAEALLKEASATTTSPEARVEILLLQLELFDKYEKVVPHLRTSEELVTLAETGKLADEQRKRLEYQVAKKAAELQKSAASNLYKDVDKVRKLRATRANRYFGLLGRLRGKEGAEPQFFQGETLFAVGDFTGALGHYQTAHALALREKNAKIQKQSMEGMLAALGQPGLSQAKAEPFYVPVYTAYLQQDPNSSRARVIRQKLFKVHMDKKNVPEAEKVMREYAVRHPDDFKTQEAMLASVMEDYRKRKNYGKIKEYVGEINQGTFKVSKKYADALRQLMTKIQIEDAQVSLNKGDKSSALKSYIRIYSNGESTPRAKANAAYNLAALYYDAGDMNQSYTWATTALKEMDDKETREFADSFLTIATNLFLRQRFQQSADLGMRTVAKLCQQGLAAKNTAFKNAAFLWLAEGKPERVEETLELGKKCGIDTVPLNEVRLELAKEYLKQRRWESLENVIEPVALSPGQAPQALPFIFQLQEVYKKSGDQTLAVGKRNQAFAIYQAAKAKNMDIPVEALDVIALELVEPLEARAKQITGVPLEFPEQKFNQTVKDKLALLDRMTNDVQEVQKTGSGKGIIKAYAVLVTSYEFFAAQLRSFTPDGKAPEYVASFQKAMASVWTPVLQTAQKRRQEATALIVKNNILSRDNNLLLAPQGTTLVPRYEDRPEMVLMDRGGKR